MVTQSPPPRRRHLIDPANPPPPPSSTGLTQVQRWVMSVLAATTIVHLSAGLAIAAYFLDVQSDRILLDCIAGVTGLVAVAAFRGIHGKSLLSAWLLVGLLPGALGLFFVVR